MTITETRNDGNICVAVEGRVDTVTSPQLQQAILQAFQKSSQVVLDLEKMEYISSSGLRALLLGQKTAQSKGGKMTLLHVLPAVMEVLDMTGFTNILNIE